MENVSWKELSAETNMKKIKSKPSHERGERGFLFEKCPRKYMTGSPS